MTNYYPVGEGRPEMAVEIAYESDPDDATQIWTDVTQDVIRISPRRGRQNELQRFEAGTLTVTLENYQRRYDPTVNDAVDLQTNGWFETTASGWGTSAGGSITRSSEQQAHGTHSGKCDTGASGNGPSLAIAPSITVAASTDYVGGFRVYIPSAYPAANPVYAGQANMDDNGGPIGEAGWAYANMAIRDEWQWVIYNFRSVTDLSGQPVVRETGGAALPANTIIYVDHAFTAPAPGSPYSGNIRPMRRIRFKARKGANEYDVWHGLVTAFHPAWDGTAGRAPVVELTAVDLFRVLALSDESFTYTGGSLTGEYIADRLNQIGWPTVATLTSGDRDLDNGVHEMGAKAALESRNLLTEMQEAAESEGGAFFISAAGKATFFDRHHRLDDAASSVATFSDMACNQDAPNNGFDAGIQNWAKDGGCTIAWDGDVDREGNEYSGSLKTSYAAATGGPRESTSSQWHQAIVGDVLEVGVWAKTSGPDGPGFALQVSEYDNTTIQVADATVRGGITVDDEWAYYSGIYVVTDADTDRVRVDFQNATVWTGDLWIDDVAVHKVRSNNEIGYRALEPTFDDSLLANEVEATWSGGDPEVLTDATSQATYLQRRRGIASHVATPGMAAALAATYLHRYKDPQLRIPRLEVDVADDGDNTVDDILGLEIWDRVTVRRHAPDTGSKLEVEAHIEGISHNVEQGAWTVTFDLSPADEAPGSGYLILDDATAGKLSSGYYWSP